MQSQVNRSKTIAANNDVTDWVEGHPSDAGSVMFELVPTGWTGTLTIQGTLRPGTSQYTVAGADASTPTTLITTTSVAAAQIIKVDSSGMVVRLKCTAYTAGSVAVTVTGSRG